MAITKEFFKSTDVPGEKETEEIKAAAKLPITYDEDSSELTDEQYATMAKAAKEARKAKATGKKGYTGFLSRLLDNAIKDPDLVARSLHRSYL